MFDKIFKPETVALVGATPKEGKVGNTLLRNLMASSELRVYAVNPKYDSILGLKCYPSLTSIKDRIDLAVIAVPAVNVPDVLVQCGEKGITNVVVISAGFKEAGREGAVLESELTRISKEYNLQLVGPNCLGVIDTYTNLNATFGRTMPDKGGIAFLSQSGAFALAVIDWSKAAGVGFSKVVSLGNKAVLNECHFLEYLGSDRNTKVIAMYLEDVSEGRRFMRVAREISKTKPVVVMKSGKTEAGSKAASSHTGSIAGSVEAFKAAFEQSGVVEAESIEDLFDFALTLSRIRSIKTGGGIAIVTNSGGPGVMAADAVEEYDLKLASFGRNTTDKLLSLQLANSYNPVDVRGDATSDLFGTALGIVARDEQVSAIIAILSPTAPIDFDKASSYVLEAEALKPVIPVFMGGESVSKAVEVLKQHGITNYFDPVRAVKTLKAVSDYEEMQTRVYEPPPHFDVDTDHIRERLQQGLGYELLTAYGIPVPAYGKAVSADEALEIADRIGYPVAMKILSPDIVHKTDVGCVKLNVYRAAVKESFFEIMRRGEKYTSAGRIDGVLVQQMIEGGREVIIGMKRDRHFGPLVMFGLGGIYVEVFRDVSFRIAPFGKRDAEEMIRKVRAYRILRGVRGEPMSDINSLVDILLRFSQLCVEFPEILEADLNPIKVLESGCYVVDFKMITGR